MDQARLFVYRLLEGVFQDVPTAQYLMDLKASQALRDLAQISEGAGMLIEALGSVDEASAPAVAHGLALEYQRLFVGPGPIPAPIWESVYFDPEHLMFGQRTMQVRAVYASHGLQYALKNNRPEDHLSIELGFMARLVEESLAAESPEQRERAEVGQRMFLYMHLGTWAEEFARLVAQATHDRFYLGAAKLLVEFLAMESSTEEDPE